MDLPVTGVGMNAGQVVREVNFCTRVLSMNYIEPCKVDKQKFLEHGLLGNLRLQNEFVASNVEDLRNQLISK